ncbi:MAG: O-antigen ligase family protein [Chthonomonadales bacterium]|nr:O-antigen ligase family protein [Chthonomonadales bacterium]
MLGSTQALRRAGAAGVVAVVLTACGVWVSVAVGHPAQAQHLSLLTFLVVPAILLALFDSPYLVPYILFTFAVTPEVRRVSDWLEGVFNSLSPISLAPTIASMALLIPVIKHGAGISGRLRGLMVLFGLALGYGLILGMRSNGEGALLDLANYGCPALMIPYITARRRDEATWDRWVSALACMAVLVAVYGWIQFLVAPAWDVFWMEQAPISSIGQPEPYKIRVFSTLNSPGPTGAFLAAALAPMLLERRWRGFFGAAGVVLVATALGITLNRTAWLSAAVCVVAYVATSTGRTRWRTALSVMAAGVCLYFLVPLLPGGDTISSRAQTFGKLGTDTSARARTGFLQAWLSVFEDEPLGRGLGAVGVVGKVATGGDAAQYQDFDNGFIAIAFTFGILGSAAVFCTLIMLARAVWRHGRTQRWPPYARLGIGMLAAGAVGLASYNFLPGLGGVLTWMFVGFALHGAQRREAAVARAARSQAYG